MKNIRKMVLAIIFAGICFNAQAQTNLYIHYYVNVSNDSLRKTYLQKAVEIWRGVGIIAAYIPKTSYQEQQAIDNVLNQIPRQYSVSKNDVFECNFLIGSRSYSVYCHYDGGNRWTYYLYSKVFVGW